MALSSHPTGGHPKGDNGSTLELAYVNRHSYYMHYVYVLCSTTKKWIYIGCTDNLKIRYAQHERGEVTSTKSHRPLKLIYYESYLNKTDARAREHRLKNHSQTKELLLKQLENSINMALSSNG